MSINPFAPLPRPAGITITPRPLGIRDHAAATAFLDTRRGELIPRLDMLAHAAASALKHGDAAEAAKLLAEAAPLREQLQSIVALAVA